MKQLVDIDEEMMAHDKALDHIYQIINQGEAVVSDAGSYSLIALTNILFSLTVLTVTRKA
jgi:hypothetical protein